MTQPEQPRTTCFCRGGKYNWHRQDCPNSKAQAAQPDWDQLRRDGIAVPFEDGEPATPEPAQPDGLRRLIAAGEELLSIAEAALLQDAVDRHETNEAMQEWTRAQAALAAEQPAAEASDACRFHERVLRQARLRRRLRHERFAAEYARLAEEPR